MMTMQLNGRIGLHSPIASSSFSGSRLQYSPNSPVAASLSLLALSPFPSFSLQFNSHDLPCDFFGICLFRGPRLLPVNGNSLLKQTGWKLGFQPGRQRNSSDSQLQLRMSSSLNKQGEEWSQWLPSSLAQTSVSPVSMPSSFISSPETEKGDASAACSIERIEQKAKASIDKLKHILYKVKTRPGDDSLHSMKLVGDQFSPSQSARTELQLQRLRDMGLFDDSSQSKGSIPHNGSGDAAADNFSVSTSFPETFVQHDPLTSTRTIVKFTRDTKAATVTIIASVGDSTEENASQEAIETSIILAARALAQSAVTLEEKANAVILDSKLKRSSVRGTTTDDSGCDHNELVSELETAMILEGTQVRKGYYAGTPFRSVYKVKLEQPDGSISEALLKPATPGDVHCRWGNASSDWVAYKVGQLLGTDMVPPAAMRRDVKVGEKSFALATLLFLVPHVKPLTQLSLQEWGGQLPAAFVSNAHILDALLGSCPRARNMFMEGHSWTKAGTRQAMLLDHPMGPGQGKLHPMWTQRGQNYGIKCVSGSTLARLRNLNKTVLTTALGAWVLPSEIDPIVERLDLVLAYFDAMSQNGNRSLAIV